VTLYIGGLLGPVCLALVLLAEPFLRAWLNQNFIDDMAVVMQLLGVGVFVGGLGAIPVAAIQAIGRPEVTAKLYAVEAVTYAPLLLVLILILGAPGAAIGWCVRAGLDCCVLLVVSRRVHALSIEDVALIALLLAAGSVLLLGVLYIVAVS
jgi:O-antigen/teichoic acid export membrane protein